MVSAERLLHYNQLEKEVLSDPNSDKKPDPRWPQGGMIVFEEASFRYSSDTPVVLKPLSFTIQPGEKVIIPVNRLLCITGLHVGTGGNYWQDWSWKVIPDSDAVQDGRTHGKYFN